MRVANLVKTTTLAAIFLMLTLSYLVCLFPSLFGVDYASFGIGSSMTPTIQEGDLVAITEVELSEVEVGDVLAVRFDELRVVHRLVEIIDAEPGRFRLKGDGNERPDQILYAESHIIGKVVAVYPLRYLLAYGPVILLTAGALLTFSLWKRPEIDLNDVLLCLIIPLIMGMLIGYKLRGG